MALRDFTEIPESQRQGTSGQSNKWIKFPQGTSRFRIIPSGTHSKDYFRQMKVHSLRGDTKTVIQLCWNTINENTETTRKKLIELQKLTTGDWALYKEFGCPTCNLVPYLRSANIRKEVINRATFREIYAVNIYYKGLQGGGQGPEKGCYLWEPARKWMKKVDECLRLAQTVYETDPLDPMAGYDLIMTVHGKGLEKDYTPTIFPQSCPIHENPLEVDYFDLIEASEVPKFKTYQQTIDYLKIVFGGNLTLLGYKIPGDSDPNNNRLNAEDFNVSGQTYNRPDRNPPMTSPHNIIGVDMGDIGVTQRSAGLPGTPVIEGKKGPIDPLSGKEIF